MPKSFCSGQVIFDDDYEYTLEDVMFLLENKEFSGFKFCPGAGYALIDSEAGEILIEYKGSDNVIPDETVRRMLDVLTHIEECIEKAYDWFSHLDQNGNEMLVANPDKKIPREIYDVNGIRFGDITLSNTWKRMKWKQYRSGSHHPKDAADIFSIIFQNTDDPYFIFNVKFDYEDLLPYEIEFWAYYS
ncbi:MAG: hypothetical protein IKI77_10770 [Oscillospiraceae bacterium]|nr:hypothetical protein [Oscillospiraceae bacterium]